MKVHKISPQKTIPSVDKKENNKTNSKIIGRGFSYNNKLNLHNFIAEKKKKYLKINLKDLYCTNYNLDRNSVSRSKSPSESRKFNSSIGVNLKNSNESLNNKNHINATKSSIDWTNNFILTESINLIDKSKDPIRLSGLNNKLLVKGAEQKAQISINKISKINNLKSHAEQTKKSCSTLISDLKKNYRKVSTKVIDLHIDKHKNNCSKVNNQTNKINNTQDIVLEKVRGKSKYEATEKIREKSKFDGSAEINLEIKNDVNRSNNKKDLNIPKKNITSIEKIKRTHIPKHNALINENKDNITEFACCCVTSVEPIIIIIRKYCDEQNIKLIYVRIY